MQGMTDTMNNPKKHFYSLLTNYGSLVGMLLVLILFQVIDNRFMRPSNLVGVMNSSSILIVLSIAMMIVMSVRGIDLSVAQVADASGVIAAMLIIGRQPVWIALLAAVGFGLLIGLINGLLMSYLGIPAIIGTLGMMFVIRSFELTLTNGAQPQILFTLPPKIVKGFFEIGQGSIGPIPMLIVICLVIAVAMYLIKDRSIIGRQMDAIQGNVKTAFLSSISIRKVFGLAFVISAVLASIAGIMLVSRSGNAVPRGVESYLTDCFVAVYIGTLVSKGRKFNLVGTVIGALFVGLLSNFFTLQSLGPAYKNIFNGLFIISAVTLGAIRQKRKN
jgi:ribose/xylose/arabinose/galactoside ABC-type transport system permease subunit